MSTTSTLGDQRQDVVRLPVDFDTPLPIPLEGRTTDYEHLVSTVAKFRSPYNLSPMRKNTIVCVSCLATIFASFAASAYAPCKDQLMEKWGLSAVTILTGIPVFTAGFALGPMALAPLSELKGRKPVFGATGVLMLLARFWAGVGGSTYSTLVGGIISDIYRPSERNTAMAIFSGGALFGIGFGPLVSGFIVDHTSWTWVFWIQVIVNAALIAVFIIVVPETRESVWLARKAAYLNKWYQGSQPTLVELSPTDRSPDTKICQVQWYVEGQASAEGMVALITTSLLRPFQLLFTEPVVFFFSAWAAFSWSVLYIMLAAVPTMFMQVYGFTLSMADATFTSACVGSILATLAGIYQEQHISLLPINTSDTSSPERRLYFSCVESLLLPIGLFMFGWSATASVHWIVPTIAIGIATAGIFSVYLAVFNYLADTYSTYASSAIAAQSFCRNAIGGVLPLVTNQMYSSLGYGPGSSLLGGIGLLLSIGPWVLIFYGPQIRSRSRVAQLLETKI
ncbi:hypothetical protein FSARC_6611 [Fusarium sarcochroum]|uniref:Major facilitator superfamily (MFS) profile domain-containing protein n=1 Tax=Fusarium sarcochroum TaxID=1208366 RepID=A0A8H4TX64_9HYPO|nr:hypothetical protein FSARC_6611 [Fusarium sarcochroum]